MKIIISVFRSFNFKFLITSYLISVLLCIVFWRCIPTSKMIFKLILITNTVLYPFSRIVYYQIRNILNKKGKETIHKNTIIFYLSIKMLVTIGLYICSILVAPFGFIILTIRVLREERRQKKYIAKN